LQLIDRGLNAHLMSSLANVSKEQLANRANLKERATDAIAMTNGLMVANDAVLAAVRALVAAGRLPVSRIDGLLRFHGPTFERWPLEGGADDMKASP